MAGNPANNGPKNNAAKSQYKTAQPNVSPPLLEVTALDRSDLQSMYSSVSSARDEPEFERPKNPTVLNLAEYREETTQSAETKTPRVEGDTSKLQLPQLQQQQQPVDLPRVYSENVINQDQFDKKFGFRRVNLSLIRIFESRFHNFKRWRKHEWMCFLKNRFPIAEWLPSYIRRDFCNDFLGGSMVAVMNVPQGLAYGFLVGLPPIYGLYTSIVGPIIYAMLGTSRHVSPGAFAIIALMVGSAVEQITMSGDEAASSAGNDSFRDQLCCSSPEESQESPANGGAEDKAHVELVLGIVTCLTFYVGLIQILLGLLNAGLLAVWLSDHLVQGLTSGAAIHVLTSQIQSMTGVEHVPATSEMYGIIRFYICFFNNIRTVKLAPTMCSIICCSCLIYSKEFLDKVFVKWMKVKIPMEFFVVLFSIVLNWSADGTEYALQLENVGEVQSGMVMPSLPAFEHSGKVIGSAMSIAIIGFVIHIALAKLISKKLNYSIDPNQEWLALGTMNTVSSCFSCFAGGASLSRTMTQVRLGTRSQMSTIICTSFLIFTVFVVAHYFYFLPKPVLSCIVVVALKDLFCQIFTSFSLFRQSIIDFLIWFITLLAVILINVNTGLIIGVAFALLTVVFRTQWPESQLLGRIPGTCDFKGLNHYRSAEEVSGVFVYRFDAPLYFANAELFLNRIRDQLGLQPYMMTKELKKKTDKAQSKRESAVKKELDPQLQPLVPQEGVAPPGDEKKIELVFRGSKVKDPSSPVVPSKSGNETPSQGAEAEVQFTHIIVDCSSFPYIDLMGLDALGQVHKEFAAISITVYFACCKVSVRQMFEQTDFYKKVPKKDMFVSLWDAVNQAQKDRTVMLANAADEKTDKNNVEFTPSVSDITGGKEMGVTLTDEGAKALEKDKNDVKTAKETDKAVLASDPKVKPADVEDKNKKPEAAAVAAPTQPAGPQPQDPKKAADKPPPLPDNKQNEKDKKK